MGRFSRRGVQTVLTLDGLEQELLPNLVQQLLDVLEHDQQTAAATRRMDSPDASVPDARSAGPDDDPFHVWEASFSESETIEDEDFDDPDPITARLFPSAYSDDPEAAYDFRRFTQADERRQKVAECRLVLDDLDHLSSRGRVQIPADHLQAWLRTLNNLRLVLSVLLGITDEVSADEAAQLPDDDPRAVVHQYYGWLGWMLESLLETLAEPA
ncbi:DUF2017 family protein [Aestuariimicrobium sp. T2.26MG-19.2B]|uniref:DUF2017 family protein n=1 Tax=Aestuariimicrobium sp. T2.26MG-19.2B TaxID=3040679 RepID=UPI0024775587|nr:DUF2017 family protein [Aestuariimicrobium sp. T2.26MG-19.2B]CAI9407554.1 hypothetical protein AESSP_01845 [Aestuariimicrobium sp. T2.26MG-19.2B]